MLSCRSKFLVCPLIAALLLGGSYACKLRQKSALKRSDTPENAFEPRKWAPRMGIVFAEDPAGGLLVKGLAPVGFAHVVSMKVGSIVTQLNGRDVRSVAEFEEVAADFAANSPQSWRFDFANAPAIQTDCDPFELIGCGPLPQ